MCSMSSPVLLVAYLLIFCASASGQQRQQQQRLSSTTDFAALLSLRGSLGIQSRDWPLKTDPCSAWTGVRCLSGRVVALHLSGLRRTRYARLAPRFAVDGLQNLTRLAVFNSTGFPLPGPIPAWFASSLPPALTVLVLRSAAVSGPLPGTLGGAGGLAVVNLSGNSLSGTVPPTLAAGLGNLTVLDLSDNHLSGPIPPSLGTLLNLNTLIVSNNSLSGPIPPQLGNLSSLASLDLSSNSLVGTLPGALKSLGSLQNLNLGRNSLSGALPGILFSGLARLRLVILSHNNFSGSLPDTFWSLPDLRFVDVSNNNLTGTLPDLVPAMANPNATGILFDLSNNLYYGSVPIGFGNFVKRFSFVNLADNYFEGSLFADVSTRNASFAMNCLRNVPSQRSKAYCVQFYAMKGQNLDVPVAPTPTLPPTSSTVESKSMKSRNWKYILAGSLGGLALLVVVVSMLVLCLMRCSWGAKEQREGSANSVPSANGIRSGNGGRPANGIASAGSISSREAVPSPSAGAHAKSSAAAGTYTKEQLLRATSNFSEENLIKHGHTGDVYRGVLEGGVPVVVKNIDVRNVRKEAYAAELNLLTKTSHARLVPLLGHSSENESEMFLVYRYMPRRDLLNALFRSPALGEEGLQSLDWITRLKIAIGVTEALCFLHHECNPPLVHRDVQASSILLDHKYEVRLGSFSKLCTQLGDGSQNVITRILRQTSDRGISGSAATYAYDIYCLGKVLLELVTGRLGISGSNNAAMHEWMDHTLTYINIFDKDLVTKIMDPTLIVDEDHMEEVWAVAIVAKSCLNPKPSRRPQARHILKALENPLKVVRGENEPNSDRLRTTSSCGSWRSALFGSWRHSSSDTTSDSGLRESHTLKHSPTVKSQGSGGESSFSCKRMPREVFPEP